jgi:potassium-transporting ATPase KdpC subunit
MNSIFRPAIVLFLFLSVLTGLAYPLLVTAIAKGVFPSQASGSIILRDGKPVGSELIGQNFTDPKYFWGRPSATSTTPYNATASGGSNIGPTNPALIEAVKGRIQALNATEINKTQRAPVPVDLVTASASGLDPHISPAAAIYQVDRVANARGLTVDSVLVLVKAQIETPLFGVFGEPRVNVLKLNLALDTVR